MLRLKLIVDSDNWYVSTPIVQTIVGGMATFLPLGQLAEIFAIPPLHNLAIAMDFCQAGGIGAAEKL